MKKNNKKIVTAILTIFSLLLMSTVVFATGSILGDIGEGSLENEGMRNMIGTMIGIIQAFATACATGMLLYLGIRYTMASANEKADLKNASTKYVIGAIIVYGGVGAFELIKTVVLEVGSGL